jgi:hypothetical protein
MEDLIGGAIARAVICMLIAAIFKSDKVVAPFWFGILGLLYYSVWDVGGYITPVMSIGLFFPENIKLVALSTKKVKAMHDNRKKQKG